MAIRYWMITNRNEEDDGLGKDVSDLSFWTSDGQGAIDDFSTWTLVAQDRFKKSLIAAADRFPALPDSDNEDQKHVTLFIHGFNNTWKDAALRYQSICKNLYDGDASLGVCILFTWPSNGSTAAYLPDRSDAESSGPALADVLCAFYDWLLDKQTEAADDPAAACKAKVSIIAHSMGNYVLQKAMQSAWTRNNRPQLVSLINQLLMVAADVDNDLFKNGEVIDDGDGDAIAALSYRVSCLYSGRDSVLGMSAGLKHFGQRRLGRSGLHPDYSPPSNVWEYDCSKFFPPEEKDIHSAYFKYPAVYDLMRQMLRGVDRGVLGG